MQTTATTATAETQRVPHGIRPFYMVYGSFKQPYFTHTVGTAQRTLASWMSHGHNIRRQDTSISFGHCTALWKGNSFFCSNQVQAYEADLAFTLIIH